MERSLEREREWKHMKEIIRLCSHSLLFLSLLISGTLPQASATGVGINYGQIANNLPPPPQVATLLKSINITRIKLYDSDPSVLSAFLNTNIQFTIGIPNENLPYISSPSSAQSYLQQHLLPFLPNANITSITVGNEALSSNNTPLISTLLPAIHSLYQALLSFNLHTQISITTAHSLNILSNSFPPSSSSFRQDLAHYIQPLLNFHAMSKSPFLINAYPYFAYKDNPNSISLPYVLFEPNQGVVDPNNGLKYDNMLYAQVDSVYNAVRLMGYDDVEVRISETGWPSKGDGDEFGATAENAAIYNGNLLRRVAGKQGTPLVPTVPIDIHVFALFNEDLKQGPTSERNYGLFYPDGTPVYDIWGVDYDGHRLGVSDSKRGIIAGLSFSLIAAVFTALILYSER